MNRLEVARLCKLAYTQKTFEERGIEVLIKRNVVCFRGTDEIWPDVLTDIRFFPWYTKEIGITPSGFVKASKRLVNKVTSELYRRSVNRDKIILAGHSLGGAVALIVGALMLRDETPPDQIITFGAPRTGALKNLRNSDVHIECFRQGKDIVPTVPPFMPRHRENIRIGKADSYIGDHSMDKYIDVLQREFDYDA